MVKEKLQAKISDDSQLAMVCHLSGMMHQEQNGVFHTRHQKPFDSTLQHFALGAHIHFTLLAAKAPKNNLFTQISKLT